MASLRPVCARCCVEMRCARNSVDVRTSDFSVCSGDLYECEQCGARIILLALRAGRRRGGAGMSWDFSMTRPGHGLATLQAELHAKGDDKAKRLLVTGDALLSLGWEPWQVTNALRALRGDVLDWFRSEANYEDPIDGCDANYTYNVSPMFYAAFALRDKDGKPTGIRGLDGRTGEEAGVALDDAIRNMAHAPDRFKAMKPDNGWGDYDSALELLRKLRRWCSEYPEAVMVVS